MHPPPPYSRAPSLCPATVSLTASASLNGICNQRDAGAPVARHPARSGLCAHMYNSVPINQSCTRKPRAMAVITSPTRPRI